MRMVTIISKLHLKDLFIRYMNVPDALVNIDDMKKNSYCPYLVLNALFRI